MYAFPFLQTMVSLHSSPLIKKSECESSIERKRWTFLYPSWGWSAFCHNSRLFLISLWYCYCVYFLFVFCIFPFFQSQIVNSMIHWLHNCSVIVKICCYQTHRVISCCSIFKKWAGMNRILINLLFWMEKKTLQVRTQKGKYAFMCSYILTLCKY